MNWAAVLLFGSGMVFSTGLVWFFVQAWIFAIQARTIWLIALLTITTTVAILSQGYLCAMFVSFSPEPKPRGVTQVNREAFASFPFDATASLVRRKGSGTHPSVGWEVKKPIPKVAATSLDLHEPISNTSSTTAMFGDGDDGGDISGGDAEGETRGLSPPRSKTDKANECLNSVRSSKSGERLHLLVPSAARTGGLGLGFEPRLFETARVAAEGHCIADAVETGRAEIVLDHRAGLNPPLRGGKLEQTEYAFEEIGGVRLDGDQFCKSLDDEGASMGFGGADQQPYHPQRCHVDRHLHPRPEERSERRCSGSVPGRPGAALKHGLVNDDEDGGGGGRATAAAGEGSQALGACRFRCCSVGSSLDCSSEACEVGCHVCAEEIKILNEEQQVIKGAGVLSLLAEEMSGPLVRGTGSDGGTGLSDGPVVRVGELPDVCAICLGQYATGEEVHVLPCLHLFHQQCLDIWIMGHASCPYCKGDLNVLPQESDPAAEASAITCSLLSGLVLRLIWAFGRVREFWRPWWLQHQEQQQHQRQRQAGGDEEDDVDNGNALSIPMAPDPAAGSPAVMSHIAA